MEWRFGLLGCLLLIKSLGCALCANPHDCKYAAYGGLRERTDYVHGRIGSVIDPAPEVVFAQPAEGVPAPSVPDVAPLRSPWPVPDADRQPSTPPDRPSPPPDAGVAPPDQAVPVPEDTLPELEEGDRIELPDLPENGPLDAQPQPNLAEPGVDDAVSDPDNDARSAARHPMHEIFGDDL
jgi:hypothetical protein